MESYKTQLLAIANIITDNINDVVTATNKVGAYMTSKHLYLTDVLAEATEAANEDKSTVFDFNTMTTDTATTLRAIAEKLDPETWVTDHGSEIDNAYYDASNAIALWFAVGFKNGATATAIEQYADKHWS